MSLKDTIIGAREEAAANGNPFERPGSSPTQADDASGSKKQSSQGFSRRSAARSKPSRAASQGVRVVSTKKKSSANMSKEERKAERKAEREVEDRRYNVTQLLLEQDPEYIKARRLWWAFLIGGVVLMGIALMLYGAVTNSGGNPQNWMGVAAIVCMVLAYVVVIAGLAFDFLKIRPMRKEAEKRTTSMSDKRLKTRLAEEARRKEAEKEEHRSRRR